MTTRPDIANPVTNSPKTLTVYFALCVPVRSANKGFNNWASCKVKSSVGYAYEAAECAKVVHRAKAPCGENLKLCRRIAINAAASKV